MITLVEDMDYVYMILIAAGIGGIGGLAAELLLKRADETGTIELPGRLKDSRYVDIGFPASIILGAVAAVAILYFFPPVVDRIRGGKTVTEYDLVKLVALSVIVGSAGPAFLTASQSRVMSAINLQKAESAVEAGKAQVDQMEASAKAAVEGAVTKAVAEHLPETNRGDLEAMVETATASVEETLKPQADVAREQIGTIAKTPEATA